MPSRFRQVLAIAGAGVRRDGDRGLAAEPGWFYAFRTEITLHRDPAKGWTFKLHTKPLSDTALGRILSQLLGTFGKQ